MASALPQLTVDMRKLGRTGLVIARLAAGILLLTIPIVAQAPSTVTGFSVTLGSPPAGPRPCSDAATAGNALYIRQGATGNGSGADWTNAITTPPSTLSRGKTYCVADTTTGFGAWNITSHPASTTYTKIIKATVADHGTSTGWSDSFGDGQAVFSTSGTAAFNYGTSGGYLEINGNGSAQTCGSVAALSGGTQGCGFKFINSASGQFVMQWNGNGTHAIVRYTELQGVSGTTTGTSSETGESFGLAAWGGGFDSGVIQYSYIHNSMTNIDELGAGATVEYNYIANSRCSGGVCHPNVMYIGGGTNGLTLRYNFVKNYDAEGFFITWFSTRTGPRNVSIYGNVMYSPGTEAPRGIELRQADGSGDVNYANILIYNNTFVSLSIAGIYDRSGEAFGGSCSGCVARNNISVNANNSFTTMTQNNNTDDSTTSRFVNLSGLNFHLTAPLAGVALTSPYNLDALGNTRGADGTWDRGAYEFCSGGCIVP